MPPQYLLPCSKCDHQIEVVPRQAGQDLVCPQCQQHIEAPMLGKMKQLELVGGTEPGKRPASSGSNVRNMLFVAGLLLAIVGGASGYALHKYASNLIYEIDYDAEIEIFDQEVDALSAGLVVELYDAMQIEAGLGEWYEPNFVRYNTQGGILLKVSYGLLGLGGLGVLLLLGSFFIKR